MGDVKGREGTGEWEGREREDRRGKDREAFRQIKIYATPLRLHFVVEDRDYRPFASAV